MPRVLSIQSHVVYGIVGNKAAVFPLELRGITVDPLNTCQLSNHTGYAAVAGARTTAADLGAVWDALGKNGLLDVYAAILTGYIGRADVLTEVVERVEALRSWRDEDQLTILCDPVCGDNGKLYVPEDVPALYTRLLKHATIATPNGFEAGLLSGIQPVDMESTCKAADWFHAQGVRLVVITSVEVSDDGDGANRILVVASLRSSTTHEQEGVDDTTPPTRAKCLVPRVEGKFSGTGDLFAAIVLSEWPALQQAGVSGLVEHLGRWCSTVHSVIDNAPKGAATLANGFSELDLVGNRALLERGTDTIAAARV